MKIEFDRSFEKAYRKLPAPIQRKVDKALELLLADFRHPSLQTKKMEGQADIYEARVDINYRVTFKIIGDTYKMRKVGTHDVLRSP
jgi:mRNA-degrading endonuclease RelE of RelBE toxin-antitoxin system